VAVTFITRCNTQKPRIVPHCVYTGDSGHTGQYFGMW